MKKTKLLSLLLVFTLVLGICASFGTFTVFADGAESAESFIGSNKLRIAGKLDLFGADIVVDPAFNVTVRVDKGYEGFSSDEEAGIRIVTNNLEHVGSVDKWIDVGNVGIEAIQEKLEGTQVDPDTITYAWLYNLLDAVLTNLAKHDIQFTYGEQTSVFQIAQAKDEAGQTLTFTADEVDFGEAFDALFGTSIQMVTDTEADPDIRINLKQDSYVRLGNEKRTLTTDLDVSAIDATGEIDLENIMTAFNGDIESTEALPVNDGKAVLDLKAGSSITVFATTVTLLEDFRLTIEGLGVENNLISKLTRITEGVNTTLEDYTGLTSLIPDNHNAIAIKAEFNPEEEVLPEVTAQAFVFRGGEFVAQGNLKDDIFKSTGSIAQDGDVIKLNPVYDETGVIAWDYTTSMGSTMPGSLTLDLNGATLSTSKATNFVQAASNKTLTIINSSETPATIENTKASGIALYVIGTLNIGRAEDGNVGEINVIGATAVKTNNANAHANIYDGYYEGALTQPANKGVIAVYDGAFTADPTAFVAAEGCTAYENDGIYTIGAIKPFAAFNANNERVGAFYEVDDAIAAAGNGGTVKLEADVNKQVSIYERTVTPLTFDLNGHWIRVDQGAGINLGGTWTFLDEYTTYTFTDSVGNGGIEITPKYFGNACISDNIGRTIIINGGTYISSGKAIYCTASDATMTINGGTFTGDIYAHDTGYGHGTIYINGGTFDGTVYMTENAEAVIEITGGTFNADPTAFVAEGYAAYDNGDTTWTVASAKVAQIGETKYDTLAEAIAAAEDGDTITLLADASLTSALTIPNGKTIVVDLNNKILTVNSGSAPRPITNRGTLTFENGAIVNTFAGTYGILDNYGTLYLTDVNVTEGEGDGGATFRNMTGGRTIVNGGTYTSTTASGNQLFRNHAYATGSYLEINDAVFESESSEDYPLVVRAGTAVFNGVTVAGASGAMCVDGASVTISNSNFTDTNASAGLYYAVYVSNSYGPSDVTINGGTFVGGRYDLLAVRPDGDSNGNKQNGDVSVTINDGTFTHKGISMGTTTNAQGYNWNITVLGGTFKNDPTAFVADGYEAVHVTGGYQVGKVVAHELTPTTTEAGYDATYTATKAVVDDNETLKSYAEVTFNVKVVNDGENTAAEAQLSDVDVSEVLNSVLAETEVSQNDVVKVEIEVVRAVVPQEEPNNNKVTYEVHPEATVTVNDVVTKVEIANENLTSSFTIKLPVPDAMAVSGRVKVTHISEGYKDSVASYEIRGTAGNHFVEITVTHFSKFEVEMDPMSDHGTATVTASLTLEDRVAINLYVTDLKNAFGGTETEPGRFKVRYTFKGVETTVTLTSAANNHIVLANCAAKEYTEAVTIVLIYDEIESSPFTYSVRDYCVDSLTNSSNQTLKDLCLALLEYGASAQERFEYNLDNMANEGYEGLASYLYGVDIPYAYVTPTFEPANTYYDYNVTSVSASLSLEAATELNVYFTLGMEYGPSNYNVYVNDQAVDFAASFTSTGAECRVKVTGIAAKDLDEAVKITVVNTNNDNGFTMYCSPLNYAYAMQSSYEYYEDAQVSLALYLYNVAANAYFV